LGPPSAKEALQTEALDHGEAEAEGLSGPSKVSHNQVFFIVNSPERAVLDWEEFFNAAIAQASDRDRVKFRKVRKVTRIVGNARFCRLLL